MFEQCKTFDDIYRAAKRHGVLDAFEREIAPLLADPGVHPLAREWLARFPDHTIWDLREDDFAVRSLASCGPERTAAVARALERLVRGEHAAIPPVPSPATLAELRAWADAHHVRSWLDAPARLVGREFPWGDGRVLTREYADRNLAAILTDTRLRKITPGARRLTERFLAERAWEAGAALAEERAIDKVLPPEGPLRDAWLRLRDARNAIAGTAPLVLLDQSGLPSAVLDEEPPAFRFTVTDDDVCNPFEPLVVRLDGEGDVVTCGCKGSRRGRCAGSRAALSFSMLWLADTNSETYASIAAVLTLPAWQRALDRLDAAITPDEAPAQAVGWRVTVDLELLIQPVRCTPKKRGGLSVRNLAMHRLAEYPLTTADRDVHTLLAAVSGVWNTQARARLTHKALAQLVGHPRVFFGKGTIPITVRTGRIGLRVVPDEGGVRLEATLHGAPLSDVNLDMLLEPLEPDVVVDDDASVVTLVELDDTAKDILHLVSRRAVFPEEAVPHLLARLPRLGSTLPVDVAPALRGREVPADLRPVVRLTAHPDGVLDLSVRVRPLPGTPAHPPGEGPPEVLGERDDERVWCRRDLAAEPAVVRDAVPFPVPDGFDWRISEPAEAIDAVAALQDAGDAVVVEWSGKRRRVSRPAGASDLRIRVTDARSWFGVDGEIEVDGAVVALAAVLEAVREGRGFVPVDGDTWVRLDRQLREALTATAELVQARRGKLSLPRVGASALDDLDGVEVDAPPRFHEQLDAIQRAAALEPAVPDALRATLRDYQRDGFTWLARTATWSPGACLADDMGLGKTLQALTLLLHRADAGPALVIAPTSLGFNWVREAERFAPSLDVRLYRGPDRDRLRDDLGPGVVLVTSYDLAVRDAEELAAIELGTLVLDEAQAIKNPDTRRARACRALQAGFVLALTGTPVENRAGDLWSLFRVLCPGLLGSRESFRARFALPIERDGDTDRRAALARIIRPFVLRRTKSEVARELPSRSEVVVDVQLSKAERRLYDAHRLDALTALERGEQGRFEVLSALTRLRQLACHPKLVDPGSEVPSAKLRTLRHLVAELRESGHRALVFSQFTRYLALVRAALEADGVTCRYLDGTTSADRRRAEVDAFQEGHGDVFLLSLKAGGTGLNLTAATYVVLLDPWWNPAAEDQAADRAHRIGQTDAVTVCRLVSRGTIEDQVVSLQGQKRELVKGLLDGTGDAATLSTDQLVGLLREAAVDDDDDEPESEVPAPDLSSLADRLEAHLRRQVEAGRIGRPTMRAYTNAVQRFLRFAEGARATPDELDALVPRYTAALGGRDAPGPASDATLLPTAYRRLVEALSAAP